MTCLHKTPGECQQEPPQLHCKAGPLESPGAQKVYGRGWGTGKSHLPLDHHVRGGFGRWISGAVEIILTLIGMHSTF